jgi:hypothetical protein
MATLPRVPAGRHKWPDDAPDRCEAAHRSQGPRAYVLPIAAALLPGLAVWLAGGTR